MATEKTLNEARMIISGFFTNRRKQLGYTQEYVAEQTGLGIATIKRFENGSFWIGMKQYLLICEALHLFPVISEMESSDEIARALRQNWKPTQPDMTIEEALKLKANRYNRDGLNN